ncbi:MAG: class I SAM-dependent methyltransferase [Lacipirellulaceae bacterium]
MAPYDSAFFEQQSVGSAHSAAIVVPLVMGLLRPSRVVDVGCGVGTWADAFRSAGASRVLGVDGDYVDRALLQIPVEDFRPVDLARDWRLDEEFDLAVSLEVAEHLSEDAARGFVERLCRSAEAVLFSAAIPHQGGTDHRNEQWPTYWAQLFAENAFACFDAIRPRVWADPSIEVWYRQNTLLFCREASPAYQSVVASSSPLAPDAVMSLVHPELFEWKVAAAASSVGVGAGPRALVGAFPTAVSRALKNRLRVGERE